jgi:hypothetical protein
MSIARFAMIVVVASGCGPMDAPEQVPDELTVTLQNRGDRSVFVKQARWPFFVRSASGWRYEPNRPHDRSSCQACDEICRSGGVMADIGQAVIEIPARGSLQLSWRPRYRVEARCCECDRSCYVMADVPLTPLWLVVPYAKTLPHGFHARGVHEEHRLPVWASDAWGSAEPQLDQKATRRFDRKLELQVRLP